MTPAIPAQTLTFHLAGRVVAIGTIDGATGVLVDVEGQAVFYPLCQADALKFAAEGILFESVHITTTFTRVAPLVRAPEAGTP